MNNFPQRRQYSKSGAQKGLEQKMKYWESKDTKLEYNILIGQAVNLAQNEVFHMNIPADEAKWQELITKWAKYTLSARLNPKNKEAIEAYYTSLEKRIEIQNKEESDNLIEEGQNE